MQRRPTISLFMILSLMGIALVVAGCEFVSQSAVERDNRSTDDGVLFETSQTRYDATLLKEDDARVEVSIPFVLKNETTQAIYLIGCQSPPAPIVQKYVDDEWITAWASPELACLSPPWEIGPGEARRDTLHLVGYLPGQNIVPTFETEIEGTYRLVQPSLYASADGEELLPRSDRTSNLFELE